MVRFKYLTALNEEEEEELKPSQIAREEQKKKYQFLSELNEPFKTPVRKEPPKEKEPEPEEEEKKEKKKGIISKISDINQKFKKGMLKFFFGEKELISPIPRKPKGVMMDDDQYANLIGGVTAEKIEAERQLGEKESELFRLKKSLPIRQIGTNKEEELLENQVLALRETITDYGNFITGESARRGVIKQIFEGVKDPVKLLKLDEWRKTQATSKEVEVMKKYERGEKLDKDEMIFFNRHRAKTLDSYVKKGVGMQAGEVIVNMPSYIMEMAVMNQMAGVTGDYKLIGESTTNLLKISSRTGRSIVEKIFDNSLKAAVAGSMAIPSIEAKTAEYMLPNYELQQDLEGKSFLSLVKPGFDKKAAVSKAYASTIVEYVSEGVGDYIDDALPFVKKMFVSKWLENKGITTIVGKVLEKGHFNSIVGEVLEEEIGEPLQAMIDERDYKDPFFTPEGRERLLVEVLGIAGFSGIAKVSDVTEKALKRRRKTMPNDIISLNVAETPEEVEEGIITVEEEPEKPKEEEVSPTPPPEEVAPPTEVEVEEEPVGEDREEAIKPEKPEVKEPKITVKKADIIPTKAGVIAIPKGVDTRIQAMVDEEAHADWRGNLIKERKVKNIIREGIKMFKLPGQEGEEAMNSEVERIFKLIKGEKAVAVPKKPTTEKYHARQQDKFIEVKGKPVEIEKEIDTFVYKREDDKKWVVTEAKSGLLMSSASTQKAAIEEAKEKVEKHGIEKIRELVKKAVERTGLSPRYGGRMKYEEKAPSVSRREALPGALPHPVRKGKEAPRGIKERPAKPSRPARRKRGKRYSESRERPPTRLSKSQQVEINKEAEKLIAEKGTDSQKYTTIDKQILRAYTGAGGLEKGGAEGRGLLDEYYTPKKIVSFIWDKIAPFLKDNPTILEPSAGIGGFFEPSPKGTKMAIEINKTSADILKVLYPNIFVKNDPFEETFITDRGRKIDENVWGEAADVVVGNPPYGEHRGKYLGLGEESKIKKYEEYFLKRGIDLLKDDGTLAYVMPSSFLRSGVSHAKQKISTMATLEMAYRLPNGTFGTTDIGTDIVIFRKTGAADPLNFSLMSNDKYFEQYPKKVLGEVLKGKGNYGADLVKGSLDNAMRMAGFQEKGMIEKAPKPLSKGDIPPEQELEVGRVEAPKTVANAANKKAIIISTKKDTTINLSKTSPEEKELWKNVEATGEFSKSYLEKKYPDFTLKNFNSNEMVVDTAVPTKYGTANKIYPNILYYQGNIYEKLDNLKKHKNDIHPAQYTRQKAGLEKVLPIPKKVSEVTLRPNSDFVKALMVTTENKAAKFSLISEFKKFLHDLPHEVFEDTSSWEIDGYIDGKIVNTGDKIRNVKVRRERRRIGDKLFKRFLREELSSENMKEIEDKYNRAFNAYHRPDYKKVPLLAKINKTFKGIPLKMSELQKEGASFLSLKGSGLLGYEVGLGKTLTAIVAINESLKKGWARKPLVVVPNAVYLQWVRELQEVIPNVKINSLHNLGGKFKGDLKTLEIEDGTISLITYSGLARLGFRMETYEELTKDLQDVMAGTGKKTKRAKAKEEMKVGEVVGKAIKGTNGDRFFEDLGFDHITIDEVHNFKNIFAGAKLEKRKGNEYRNVRGSTSARGIKAYLMTQYILKNNNERNVFLLSATPFTNSPLEIYSIMSLMGKKRLEEVGLKNVNDFMSMFVDMRPTFVVKANQTVQQQDIIEKFVNLQQLQKLVTEFIDFRTGEEVGVERPSRRKKTISLHPTRKQVDYIKEAQALFQDKKGGVLKAISELQNITLSPYLSRYSQRAPTYKQFVENSPKVKFAIEAIAQNKKDKPEAGQVLYMPRGVDYLPLLKQYLIKEKGYRDSQVGIIKGGMSVDAKYSIQNRFNQGKIKVLIGTEAIKEGVNLQEKSTDLYHLHLPWNPTDMLQIEGRIWRQGNDWKNVRIHYPLIENSVDSFIFQKLETKEKRIKNLWSYKENEVNVGDLDFEGMKLDLITDPVIRVQAEKSFVTEKENAKLRELEAERAFASRKTSKVEEIKRHLKDMKEYLTNARKEKDDDNVEYYTERVKETSKKLKTAKKDLIEQGLDLEELKSKAKKFTEKITTQEKVIEKLEEKFTAKLATAEKKRISTIVKTNDFGEIIGKIAEENKTFFVKRKILKGKYKVVSPKAKGVPGGYGDVGGYADIKSVEKKLSDIKSVEMPELVRIARKISGNTPTLKKFRVSLGMFYAKDNGYLKFDPDIFKNPEIAAKVMSHDLGHMVDYLEDKTMFRGNLVGRIASLNKHLKHKFDKLREPAIRKELKALTQKWKPFDENESESFTKYRYSSKELYADAISVLFNDPVLLKQEAPKFWKGFFKYLNKKPIVEKNVRKIWNLLNQGEEAIFRARDKELDRAFKKGEEAYTAKYLEREKRKSSLLYQTQVLFDDKNTPIIKKLRQAQKAGKPIAPQDNPEYALHGLNYTDGKLKNYVNDKLQPAFNEARKVSSGWETLGKMVFLERVVHERGELANPQGYSPKTAKKQLEMMQKNMGEKELKTLNKAKKMFRDGVQESVKYAEDNEYYSEEMIKQMKMNPAYATYQVIDYLDTYISSKVYQQVGTLKDVSNVATATTMKLISTRKAIERNNAKKISIEFMKKNFSEEIEAAKTKWNGKFMQIRDPSDPDIGLVIIMEKGKPQGYYMDKDIANTLNYNSNKSIRAMARVSRALSQSRFYRPLFTSFNLGFQSFNFVRDFMRYWKNVPDRNIGQAITSFPRAIVRYVQAAPYAAKRALHIKSDLIKQMENSKILGLTYNDMFRSKRVDTQQKQIERILEKTGVLSNTKRSKLFAPFHWLLDAIETVGNFIETLPKVAGYIELKDRMPEAELAEFIRTNIGSPDFRIGGTATPVTNNIFFFSNAIKEGIKSDLKIAFTKNKSRSGFWWKTVATTFLPKIIMAGIVAGLWGDELKEILEKASEYDKTNYTIIPLALDENNDAIYLRIPQDETGRFLGGLLWKILRLNKDEKSIRDVFDIFSFGAGQFPTLSPAFTGAGALLTYLAGKNPYDSYRGRSVIPDKEFQAGIDYSFPILAKWLVKNQGLGIFFPTNTNYYNTQITDLKKTLNAPFISNIIGRWIKVSSYGEREKLKKTTEPIKREKAIKLIKERKKLDEAIKEYQSGSKTITRRSKIEKQLIKDIVGKPPYKESRKAKVTNTKKKFRIAIWRGESDEQISAVIDAHTIDEKLVLLKGVKQGMDRKKYIDLLKKLIKYKVISLKTGKKAKKL